MAAAAQVVAQPSKTPLNQPTAAVTVAAWLSALVAGAPVVPTAPPTSGPLVETPGCSGGGTAMSTTPTSAAQQAG
eukprot:CAMPEP_0180543408 /NCGR_PEP_ID=MMETSP1036_2-20121128/68963_1 /TAXON_ID=632150 /ORGANISM="Azadinium spinosum, Strain 3D9" /LENGTH=74 /DNA_ID=CAMNT_0022558327 /DNA_START=15 /DNA_END=235 /DNA_ORIENTATION=+